MRDRMAQMEADYKRQCDELRERERLRATQSPPILYKAPVRPFFPRVTRLDPKRYQGDRWAIDGRHSERYTPKTWRMCMHVVLATVFG